jgi:hypothetical protein
MSGKKQIVLVNGSGKSIHSRYCYKRPQVARNRAIDLAMEGKHRYIQIWHKGLGCELAYVSRTSNSVTLTVLNR